MQQRLSSEQQRQRVAELEAAARKVDRRVKSLEETLAQLNKVLKEKDEEARAQATAAEALQVEMQQLRGSEQMARGLAAERAAEAEELRAAAAGAEARASELEGEVVGMRAELAEAGEQAGAREGSRQAAEQMQGKLDEAREQARLAQEESQMKDLNLNLLEEKVAELEGRVRRRNAMIESLEADMRERQEAAALEDKLIREPEAAAAEAYGDGDGDGDATAAAAAAAAAATAAEEARERAAKFEARTQTLEQAVARLEAELLEKEGTINILQDSLK